MSAWWLVEVRGWESWTSGYGRGRTVQSEARFANIVVPADHSFGAVQEALQRVGMKGWQERRAGMVLPWTRPADGL